MKKCPYCIEEINDEATKCKHCLSELVVCKIKVEKEASTGSGCLFLILLSIGILMCLGGIGIISKEGWAPAISNIFVGLLFIAGAMSSASSKNNDDNIRSFKCGHCEEKLQVTLTEDRKACDKCGAMNFITWV